MFSFSSFSGVLGILALILCSSRANAEVLATRVYSWNWGSEFIAGMTIQNAGYQWQIFTGDIPIDPAATVWESVRFTAADVGSTFEANAANDPMFHRAATLLSDGLANIVGMLSFVYASSPTGSSFAGEGPLVSDRLALFASTPNAPIDLVGYEITAMRFRLNAYFLTSAPEPNGGISFEHRGQVTITVEGRVPEPTILSGLVPALLGFVFSRRCRSRR